MIDWRMNSVFLLLFCVQTTISLNPVILVPGDGGSQIQAKLDKPSVVHYLCSKKSDYYSLWLNLEILAPYVIDCFVDNMRLVYNATSRNTTNSPGVFTMIPDFGSTSSVEWLDPDTISHFTRTSYFAPIVDSLVSKGFVRGKSVRGAPYDFRKAPNEFGEYYDNLKKLVEDTYSKNNNSAVVLLAHSMGNPTTLYFLNHQPQAWKDKYINKFITLAGVWAGSVKPIRLYTSGDSLGVPLVNPNKVRKEQRSMPSTAWLLPSPKFWNKDEILAYQPNRTYTVNDYKQFFTDINFLDGYEMRKDTENLIMDLKAPGVEVHCLHGHGLPTPGAFKWDNKKTIWPDSQPFQVNDDGDGTVNIRSLLACLSWNDKQKQKIYHKIFAKAEHMAILNNKDVISYILSHVGL
ncbi:hypothetical protein LOTGIDRAFT_220528 [Lottia gigantea]|uniref:Group XV phospholipase A2 n=1 Tax=Lottia gigantea TaxID=225164 RepID=V3ZZS9_LOTGI|nr:hypothetical protein LOTGIDRAFT_220528 [Lottia gigantea]ESO86506.1 hypothetical protein LOTGIDRAFT_220528 [Lottia gigantea]